MSLLSEIQKDAANNSVPISSLLRKCLILARKLKSKDLEKWANNELTGYQIDEVPDYRNITRNNFVGDFNNGFKSITNAPIPLSNIAAVFPDRWKDITAPTRFKQSVALIEDALNTVRRDPNRSLGHSLPTDLAIKLSNKVYAGMACTSARSQMSAEQLASILDIIRTKVLQFAMDIEEENPNAGEASPTETPVAPEKVTQVFHQNFHGSVGNVATGSSNFQQSASVNPVGQQLNLNVDMATLREELSRLRANLKSQADEQDQYVALGELAAAEKAIDADDQPKLIEHLKTASQKAGEWLIAASTTIGTSVAAEAIKHALHLGTS